MKYGHFSKDNLEYIITNPQTPRPWINYLTNDKYCALISQTGGGFSFYQDFKTDRITRWEQANLYLDRPGRYIYLRDEESGDCWSITWQPMRKKLDFYRCRHGLGYTVIESQRNYIRAEVCYFVPGEDSCEVWKVKLANEGDTDKKLSIFPYIEWLLGNYYHELVRRNIMNLYNRVWFDKDLEVILGKRTARWGEWEKSGLSIRAYTHLNFFASSLQVEGYDCRKASFVGNFRTEENPETLERGNCSNSICSGEDAVGAFQHRLILKPGETKEFAIILGRAEDKEELKKLLSRYRDVKKTEEELGHVKKLWLNRINKNFLIETPDSSFNQFFNVWVKYQVYIRTFWSNDLSFYHEGTYGGRGYRDSAQDSEALASLNPGITRERIKTLASLVRRDGTCAPGWSDTSGPWEFRPRKDNPTWLVPTVAAYIKETGDSAILNEEMSYLKDKWIKGGSEEDLTWKGGAGEDGEGTLLEHILAQLNYTFNDQGPHGLPRIGYGDWNDGLDATGIKGKGESVWLAFALIRSLKLAAELADLVGKQELSQDLKEKARIITENVEKHGWDGEWYLRGYTDEGKPFGSSQNKEGKIYLNSQVWAILSGVAREGRLTKLLNSIDTHLSTPHGLAMFSPAYNEYNPGIGRSTMFSPGTKENAAIFNHVVGFSLAAYCMLGKGNKAYQLLCQVMPNTQSDYDLYKSEPYVTAEYLIGPDHPYRHGEGAFSWVTGSSSWFYLAFTEWMLGIKRDYKGLLIEPCLPSHWERCKVIRNFREAAYEITIENPDRVEKGVKEIFVDDKKIESNLLPVFGDGKTHYVKVIMGRK